MSTQISTMSVATAAALKPTDVHALSTAQVAALTAQDVNAISKQSLQAFSNVQIAALSASAILGLSSSTVASLSTSEVAALTSAQTGAMSSSEIQSLQLNSLSKSALNAIDGSFFSASQVAGLSTATLGNLTTAQFAAAVAPRLASLTTTQLAKISASQIATVTSSQLSSLSNAQLSAMSATTIGALSATQQSALTASQLNGMTQAQLRALNVANIAVNQISGLSVATLNAFSTQQMSSLKAAQIQALTTAQVSALSSSNLSALNLTNFGAQQIAGLSAAAIGSLSVATFDAAIAPNLGALSTAAVKGITTAQVNSLTAAQAASLTQSQLSAMGGAQAILVQVKSLESNGSLSYNSMLSILQTAATGGMNAQKFAGLQALSKQLNTSGGISTTAYVQQIFNNVVNGNSANAKWNGGSATATALGNLTAASTQTQVNELIGKWFLGTDMPSINVSGSAPASYQVVNEPLFSGNGPQASDINQGNVGDCYFLSALAETASNDPSLIQNMIKSNGNGTYSVEFQVAGKADYVTVNNELPVLQSGYHAADGSTLEFDHGGSAGTANDWSALVEKAYAQLMAQTAATPGMSLNQHGNGYQYIEGGLGNGITVITGQSVAANQTIKGQSASATQSLMQALQSAIASKEDVEMGTGGSVSGNGNLVAGHMFEVTGINLANGTVSLTNPWGGSGISSGKQMSFTDTIADLVNNNVTFFSAMSQPVTA